MKGVGLTVMPLKYISCEDRILMAPADDHTLEFLLGFNGAVHVFPEGYWTKIEIKRGRKTKRCLHGLRYSFTLHDASGKRLMGFDNAHPVREPGSRFNEAAEESDHWHRDEKDKGRPYTFTTAEQLIVDFEREAKRILSARGVLYNVVAAKEK